MDFSRRGLMGFFAGLTGAAATGVSPRDLMAETAHLPPAADRWDELSTLGVGGPIEAAEDPIALMKRKLIYKHIYPLRRKIERRTEEARWPSAHLPIHIANKRSWSEVYKRSVAMKEYEQMTDLLNKLSDDDIAWTIYEKFFAGKE